MIKCLSSQIRRLMSSQAPYELADKISVGHQIACPLSPFGGKGNPHGQLWQKGTGCAMHCLHRCAIDAPDVGAGHAKAHPQIALAGYRKRRQGCSDALDICSGEKPDAAAQALVKDPSAIGRKASGYPQVSDGAPSVEQAFVETIAFYDQPAI